MKKTISFLLINLFIFSSILSTYAAGEVSTKKLSPGVNFVEQKKNSNNVKQVYQVLDINLNDTYTDLEIGFPNGGSTLGTVSSQARSNSIEGRRVVGATNAAFFDVSTRQPVHLMVQNGQLNNLAFLGFGSSKNPLNLPLAFGMTNEGKAHIGIYDIDVILHIGNESIEVPKVNADRGKDSMVLYMSPKKNTGTNEWGTEIIVPNAIKDQKLNLGKVYEGKVSRINRVGHSGNAAIPQDGFVISAHGEEWSKKLKNVKQDDSIKLEFKINKEWENAKFIIGTGPILVEKGRVAITMDESQSFAKARHPRTAVAVDKTGERVFLVTVDGRAKGYSDGATLKEMAEYLVGLGADYAINLDGGGSTAMAVRKYGDQYPTIVNRPSDGTERAVLNTLLAVSTAPIGQAKIIKMNFPQQKIIKGTKVSAGVAYILDEYYNPLPINENKLTISVKGDIGVVNGHTLQTTNAGQGKLVATYENSISEAPVTVVETFDQLKVEPKELILSYNQAAQFKVEALDSNGQPLLFDPNLVQLEVQGDMGEIVNNQFVSGNQQAEGKVIVTLANEKVEVPVKVGAAPILIDSFEKMDRWKADQARAISTITNELSVVREGKSALALSYDFTTKEEGIKAAYVSSTQLKPLPGRPLKLGMWVYGDGKNHWLRGSVIDGNKKQHTLNFTEEGGLNWIGWKYVEAVVPVDLPLPISLERIYIAETKAEKQNKGKIYFDKLQAVYTPDYEEPLFKDLGIDSWGYTSVKKLVSQKVISGYPDGTFKPEKTVSRAEAAVMIAKSLGLISSGDVSIPFKDVKKDHFSYKAVAGVYSKGYIKGKTENTYGPNANITKAELAVLLNRIYKVEGQGNAPLPESVKEKHWAYKQMEAMITNQIMSTEKGFHPDQAVTRVEFADALIKLLEVKK